MKRIATLALLGVVASCGARPSSAADTLAVDDGDTHRFVDALRRVARSDTLCLPFDAYIAAGSAGLRAYASKFDLTRNDLCRAVGRRRARYDSIQAKLPALDSSVAQLRVIADRLRALRPDAVMAPVYMVVGDGIAAGTTTRGRHPMVLVGVELNRDPGRLPWTVAHELAHTQQDYPLWGSLTGGPRFLRGTLLRASITEGSADLVAEVLTGWPKHDVFGEAHEAELWRDFQRDMHSRDYGGWLYNGATRDPLHDRPADMGYWVGYRIARAYYDRASDKRAALNEILTIHDFDAFLAASGYAGGASSQSDILRR
jgi:hypothetical protein